MPRPTLPPTPAASTDITGKADPNIAHDQSWTLPPAALGGSSTRSLTGSASPSSVASCNASDSSYHPNSPPISTSPTASRKRSNNSVAVANVKEDYGLPPPPTRCRKIIQMKPKAEQLLEEQGNNAVGAEAATPKVKQTGGRRKKGDGQTAAGKKIARKTAHSLIERRRRSKMNEEFGVLKDMIPACAGQEMHKLAILQASIEYMRYLESCVSELKTSRRTLQSSSVEEAEAFTPPAANQPFSGTNDEGYEESDSDKDEEMSEADDAVCPTTDTTPNASYSYSHSAHTIPSTTTSPSIYPVDTRDHGHFSATTSPAFGPVDRRSSSFSLTTSPNFYGMPPSRHHTFGSISSTTSPSILPSPGVVGVPESRERRQSFALTSPALGPQPDSREDHEAAMTLGMLNGSGRAWAGAGEAISNKARGMSVRDLLSG